MAFKNKSNKLPTQEDLPIVQLIDVTTNALIKLITTGTSTVIALGILVILTATILKADSDVQ